MTGVDADDWQATLVLGIPEPDGERTGLHADPFELDGASAQPACDRIRNPPALDPSTLGDGQDGLAFNPFAGIEVASDEE